MQLRGFSRFLGPGPASRIGNVPGQGILGSISIDDGPPEATIICFDVVTDCPLVGAYPVGGGRQLSAELVFPVVARPQRISVFVPRGSERVDFRNAANVTLPKHFEVVFQDSMSFDDLRDIGTDHVDSMFRSARKSIFIHTIGKTGSVALAEAMSPLQDVLVIREHWANLPSLQDSLHGSARTIFDRLTLRELTSRRIVMHILNRGRSVRDSLDVITGIRRSETLLISALFQNHGNLFIELGLSIEEILRFTYKTAACDWDYDCWWVLEFFAAHQFGLEQLRAGLRRDGLTWTFRAPSGVLHRFYRIEDGEDALRETLQAYSQFADRPELFPDAIPRTNAAADKRYSELYKEVLEKADFNLIRQSKSPLTREIEALFYDAAA
jgi:hypothetical protein